ncbi:unnamed protein product [Chironomus riparius]|uniref:Uncharacterized protein n=1 Tax=Chironomus riparius TaxID=315576 RepID=A0A9N9S4C8_9DIPT|nr:unnamed protein product [Chironomus riparius]
MGRLRKKKDLRKNLLKKKYLKRISEAKKNEAQIIEVESISAEPLQRTRRGISTATRAIAKKRACRYTKFAIRIVRRLQRFAYGLKYFVGLTREPLMWNEDEDDDDEADGNE